MSNFMNSVKSSLVNGDHNVSTTTNGALGYKTTGRSLLDLNFSVSSMRSQDDLQIIVAFMEAFRDNSKLAIKWLFFARDVREGLGERRLFRIIFKHLADQYPNMIAHLIPRIAEYGRWDDVALLLDTKLAGVAFKTISEQLHADVAAMERQEPISLLAKWLPSITTSSHDSVLRAKKIARGLGIKDRGYRKILSKMRKYIDVIEVKMSDKNWDEIDYQRVPSRANLLYSKAFLRNDEERRREFLTKLENGEAKINAGTLYPHDIVHRYLNGRHAPEGYLDATLEALWRSLPNTITEDVRTMVVADGSGSMTDEIGKDGSVTALEVANALAIYFAERMSGEFRDKYITFSMRPQFVDFSGYKTLHEKLSLAARYREVSNTDVRAVFNLILETAVRCQMKQSELPTNILLISDMEFDGCGEQYLNERLFEVIARDYEKFGYKIPRVVFWNVNSKTGTIPVKESDLGVALVSGFSTNVAKMVMSGKTDPYECLVETLMSERYADIDCYQLK